MKDFCDTHIISVNAKNSSQKTTVFIIISLYFFANIEIPINESP